jgi:hypothetical protein
VDEDAEWMYTGFCAKVEWMRMDYDWIRNVFIYRKIHSTTTNNEPVPCIGDVPGALYNFSIVQFV